jgi:accessory colonization factor AcfC
MASNILGAFNDHFVEFISDIQLVFPDDVDLLTAKNSLIMIRKANPKMIIKIWKTHIVDKYAKQIGDGDLTFFMDKDYSNDISGNEKIMEGINRLREPVKNMSKENQDKTLKYIQNLTKLCNIYHQ